MPHAERKDACAHSAPLRRTIHDLLAEARKGLARLSATEAYRASLDGGVIVDTRSEDERRAEGLVPGARHHPLSTLEWELDPASGHSDPRYTLDSWVILLCREGYSSSLAAARLRALGFHRATDVVGGMDAWKALGLPVLHARPET
jgi:rhodanese-related sulfurtransferase